MTYIIVRIPENFFIINDIFFRNIVLWISGKYSVSGGRIFVRYTILKKYITYLITYTHNKLQANKNVNKKLPDGKFPKFFLGILSVTG